MSGNRSRRKGASAEVEVAHLIADLSGYHCLRTRTPGAAADVGDIAGLPNTVVEVKNRASIAEAIAEGLPQAQAASERTGWRWPTVWVRRPGGRYVVCMTPETFLALHREATG